MKRLLSVFLALAILCSVLPLAGASGFSDVKAGSWYAEAVEYAVKNNLMNGVGGGKFAPDTKMSRAMLVTVLWRYAGSPEEGTNSFTDVENGQWYEKAVAWAAKNGVVTGVGNGKFDPDGTVTREQLAAVLYRYSNAQGMDTSRQASLNVFPDGGKVSAWAVQALSWAVAEGLVGGSDGKLLPQGNATRAQVATILMRYIEGFCLRSTCEHKNVALRNVVYASCVVDGYTGDWCCVTCGYCTQKGEVIPQYGHNYENNICTRCGENVNTEFITVAGKNYRLGMSEAELLSSAGQPDEKLPSVEGCVWYVYGTKTYKDFFMAGIYGGKVVSLCATGLGFSYRGSKMGGAIPAVYGNECLRIICGDRNDNNIFLAVKLTTMSFWIQDNYSEENLAGEARANFHLTNAFRVYHGKNILQWCDKAATSARLHCKDMASRGYLEHITPEGLNPGDRMRAQGVRCNGWSENIAAGYPNAFEVYDGWVNSSSHRKGMLGAMTHLGVGFATANNSAFVYSAQNFYNAVQ